VKFQPGDQVAANKTIVHCYEQGTIYTVVEQLGESTLVVNNNDGSGDHYFSRANFELVEPEALSHLPEFL
jgi:hypothetical protein